MIAKCDYLTINVYSLDRFVSAFTNDIAQIELHFKCTQCVNHFVHGVQCLTLRWSGKAIDKIGQSFFDLIRELTLEQNFTCSRIDFCIDFDADLDYVRLDAENQETSPNTGRFGNEKSGRTLSAGTRGYKLVRLYEKGKESKNQNTRWQRIEVEYSQHLAKNWLVKYLNCENDPELLTAEIVDSMKQTMPIAGKVIGVAESFTECDAQHKKTNAGKFLRHISLCAKALAEEPKLVVDVAKRLSDTEIIALMASLSDEVTRRSRELADRQAFAQECCASLRKVLDAQIFEKRDYISDLVREYKAMVDLVSSEGW